MRRGGVGSVASTHIYLHILEKSLFLNEEQFTQTIIDHIQKDRNYPVLIHNCTLVTLAEGADRLFEGGGGKINSTT